VVTVSAVVQSEYLRRYGLDDRNLIPCRDQEGIFLFTAASIPALGPTHLLASGYGVSFDGVKAAWADS